MTTINRGATHAFATVLSNKRVGQYHQILLGVGDLVKVCKPGNFVAIKVGGDSSRMILRRAFAGYVPNQKVPRSILSRHLELPSAFLHLLSTRS